MSHENSVDAFEAQTQHIMALESRVAELEQDVRDLTTIQNSVAALARELARRLAKLEDGSS